MSILEGLSRLFQPASREVTISVIDAKEFSGRERTVEVVGEASYQAELAKIAGPKDDKSKNHWTKGELIPETWNRKDRNAVMVRIDGLTIGYLATEHAVAFKSAMASRGYEGYGLVGFKARIVGGWRR